MNILERLPPFGEKITITLPVNMISDDGIKIFNEWIDAKNLPETPPGWDWIWVAKNGPYVGTFPKRYSNYVYKYCGIRMSPSDLSNMGNMIAAHTSKTSEYIIDFTDSFDWEAGDFGDGGSCFWEHSRKGVRTAIYNAGGIAIRFWKQYKPFEEEACSDCAEVKRYNRRSTSRCNKCFRKAYSNKLVKELSKKYGGMYGYARAWFLPYIRNSQDRGVVFNGYSSGGAHTEIQTLGIVRVISHFLGLSYKKVDFYNSERDGGFVYINNGIGYLLGGASNIDSINEVAINMELRCWQCKTKISGLGLHCFVDTKRTYCPDCGDKLLCVCSLCLKYVPKNEAKRVLGRVLCTTCESRAIKTCIVCKERFSYVDLRRVRCDRCIREGRTPIRGRPENIV